MLRSRGRRVTALVAVLALAVTAVASVAIAKKKTVKVEATNMVGAVEVPPGDPDGTGNAKFKLKKQKGEVCFDADFQSIQAPFAAHIHKGDAGVAGPIKVPMFDIPDGATSPQSACVDASASLIKKIGKKPGRFYCNIHTDDFPAGAIRGQLTKPGGGGGSGGGGNGGPTGPGY
jgi:hypothetical protein